MFFNLPSTGDEGVGVAVDDVLGHRDGSMPVQDLAELAEGIAARKSFDIGWSPAIALKGVVEFRRLAGRHYELVIHDVFSSMQLVPVEHVAASGLPQGLRFAIAENGLK